MKIMLLFAVLLFSLACNNAPKTVLNKTSTVAVTQPTLTPNNPADEQPLTLAEQGIAIRLPKDWQEDGDPLFTETAWFQRWYGPDNTVLTIHISDYKTEYKQDSIAESVNSFYDEKKGSGAKDVRFLEIGGVRGVHYLSPLEEVKRQALKWEAQYIYKGKRRIFEISFLCLDSNFAKQRDALYGILQSIQFQRSE